MYSLYMHYCTCIHVHILCVEMMGGGEEVDCFAVASYSHYDFDLDKTLYLFTAGR